MPCSPRHEAFDDTGRGTVCGAMTPDPGSYAMDIRADLIQFGLSCGFQTRFIFVNGVSRKCEEVTDHGKNLHSL